MSIALDSTDYIQRTASVPASSAFTIAGWFYFNSLPASDLGLFDFCSSGGGTDIAKLRWAGAAHTKLRLGTGGSAENITTAPSAGAWVYVYMRNNASNAQAGWKTIAESSFDANKQISVTATGGTGAEVWVGANRFDTTSLDMLVFRLSVWNEFVSDANLLLAAATDLGYITNINTHIAGTATGDPARYADSSGNARNWTASGTITDGSNPSIGASTAPVNIFTPSFFGFNPGFGR